MALLKGKEVVHFIPRHEIEGHDMEEIMKNLTDAFDAHCEMPEFRAFSFGEKMITTSYRPSEYTIHTAQSLSVRLGDTYCSRNKQPIEKCWNEPLAIF